MKDQLCVPPESRGMRGSRGLVALKKDKSPIFLHKKMGSFLFVFCAVRGSDSGPLVYSTPELHKPLGSVNREGTETQRHATTLSSLRGLPNLRELGSG